MCAVTSPSPARLGVLMVTGAYYPELSGGGLQARAVVQALRSRIDFLVLTTSIQPELPARADDDGVPVYRILVRVGQRLSEMRAAIKTISFFIRTQHQFDIVNLHGFSRKAVLIYRLARMLRKRFVLTLQTGGHDEPGAARALGRRAFDAYAGADLVISVSPGLTRAYVDGGLPPERVREVSNAVDTNRFRPVSSDSERSALRRALGLPIDRCLVLFVGYFSADKRPSVLYDAWRRLPSTVSSTLVFVGATDSKYKEVDPALAATIRRDAEAAGHSADVLFVPPTSAIEQYYRACNVYVLPSRREGLPIALLEAMASGLACVASRLPGSTDGIIDTGTNGVLVEVDDAQGFSDAIAQLSANPRAAAQMGAQARATIVERYSIAVTAERWRAAYEEVVRGAQ
jgi:glycosyltransferase involved in cell wall biosynthesis